MKNNNNYTVEASWLPRLRQLGLDDFEAFWRLPRDWVDEPNREGEGWSGVTRHTFASEGAGALSLYLKRQENFFMKKSLLRVLGITSLMQEERNFARLARAGVEAAPKLAFGVRRVGRNIQCLLALQALDDYISLDHLIQDWQTLPWTLAKKRQAAGALAQVVARLHEHHFEFSALYPKHIFFHRLWFRDEAAGAVPVRLIDLERVKWRWSRATCARNDLEKLNRYCAALPSTLRLAFYQAYRGIQTLGPSDKRFLRQLLAQGK